MRRFARGRPAYSTAKRRVTKYGKDMALMALTNTAPLCIGGACAPCTMRCTTTVAFARLIVVQST